MNSERSPHLTAAEVRRLVAALDGTEGQARRDLMARLAWRPAWAIRSRREAFSALREIFSRRRRD